MLNRLKEKKIMRMNKLFTLITIVISATIITSCATTQPREKLLVGTWIPLKVDSYVSPYQKVSAIPEKKVKVTDTTTTEQQNTELTSAAASAEEKKAKQLEHFFGTQIRTKIKVNADKTCEIQAPGKSTNATWKLKKKGTILAIKETVSGKKRILELVQLNDTSAMIIQRTKTGDFIARYRKQ
jgi:hypothetical protein